MHGTTPGRDVLATIIVPTFNEGDNVAELVRRLENLDMRIDVLFVDDSTDSTPQIIRQVAATSKIKVHLLHREPVSRIGGLGGAVVAGLRATSADWAVVMDGDLQHPPETVRELLARAYASNLDIVVASRYVPGGDAAGLAGGVRRAVSSTSTRVAKALFPTSLRDCSDPMTGFFALRRDALDVSTLQPLGFKILLEILARNPLRVGEIPFVFQERFAGESKANMREGFRFLVQLMRLRRAAGQPQLALTQA